jgi:putative transposase
MLPYDFPPWGTVYYWFGRWRLEGLWQRILVNLRRATRQKEGRNPAASDAIVDSQSVRVFEESGGIKGHDAGKNLPGRKRHLLVDASGLLRAVRVTPAANTSDSRGAREPCTGALHGPGTTATTPTRNSRRGAKNGPAGNWR